MSESTRSGKTGTLFWLPVLLDCDKLDPTDTLLLIALADHVGDDDACFVGIERLSQRARVGYSTAKRRLTALEQRGVLSRTRRRRDDGNLSVYAYHLERTFFGLQGLTSSPDHGSPERALTMAHPGEPAEPPRTEPPHKTPSAKALALSEGFDEFWENYLRKEGKPKARKVWNARRKQGVPPEELIQAGANYMRKCKIQRTEVKFIKLAATFLGPDEHWKDYLDDGAAMADVQYLRAVGDTIYDETPVVYS